MYFLFKQKRLVLQEFHKIDKSYLKISKHENSPMITIHLFLERSLEIFPAFLSHTESELTSF